MVTENVDEERPEEEETCLGVCSEMKQRLGNHKQEGLQEGQALLKVGDQRVEENMDLREGRTMAYSPTFYSCWRCLLEKCSTKPIHLLEYQMVGAASKHCTASPMLLSHCIMTMVTVMPQA